MQYIASTRHIVDATIISHSTESGTNVAENVQLPGIRQSLFSTVGTSQSIIMTFTEPLLPTFVGLAGLNSGSAHRNLLSLSHALSNAEWTETDATFNLVTNPVTPLDPFNGTRAFLVQPSGSAHTASHKAVYAVVKNLGTGITVDLVFSIYASSGGGTNIQLEVNETGGKTAWARYDLSGAGAIITTGSTGVDFNVLDSSISRVGTSDWYRCVLHADVDPGDDPRAQFGVLDSLDAEDTDQDDNGTAFAYFYGAQVEIDDGYSPTALTETDGTAGATWKYDIDKNSILGGNQLWHVSVSGEDMRDLPFAHTYKAGSVVAISSKREYFLAQIYDEDSGTITMGAIAILDASEVAGGLIFYRGVDLMPYSEPQNIQFSSGHYPTVDSEPRLRVASYGIQLTTDVQSQAYRKLMKDDYRDVFIALGDNDYGNRSSAFGIASYGDLVKRGNIYHSSIGLTEYV